MRSEASAELIAQARHDRDAFGQLYKIYVHRVYAFCLAHTHHREGAEDLTSQTFERALRMINRYEDRSIPLSKWLLRIAANAILEQIRHDRISAGHVMLEDTAGCSDDRMASTRVDPAQIVEWWEQMDWLWAHVMSLSTDHQTVLYLRFWEDRAIDDVAVRMGRSPAAARQLLYRSIRALRARLLVIEESGDDGRERAPAMAARRRGTGFDALPPRPGSSSAQEGGGRSTTA